jgi:non-heme chloroperoxidase
MASIKGGGLNLALCEAGRAGARPIVFIHGFSGSHLSWDLQFCSALAGEFHLVAFDLRGHGASDKPLAPESYTDSALWAADLSAVIAAGRLQRPVLVGFSYGGYVISDYVRTFGDQALGGLVLVGCNTKNGTDEAMAFLTEEVLAIFPDVLSPDLRNSVNATRALTRMFADPPGGEIWEAAYGSAMMVPPAVRLAMFSRVLDNDDVLGRIRVPAMVIHGAADRIVRLRASEHNAAKIPGAALRTFDGLGHAPFLEDPQRFNSDLAEFVRSLP